MPCSIPRVTGSGHAIDATPSTVSGSSYAPAAPTAKALEAAPPPCKSKIPRHSAQRMRESAASPRALEATGTGAPSRVSPSSHLMCFPHLGSAGLRQQPLSDSPYLPNMISGRSVPLCARLIHHLFSASLEASAYGMESGTALRGRWSFAAISAFWCALE